jgi:hypothetical protein
VGRGVRSPSDGGSGAAAVASGAASPAPSVGVPESTGIGSASSGGRTCCCGGGASACASCSIPRGEARASDHQAAAERRGCAGLPASRVLRLRRMWTGFRGDSVGGCRLPVACCVLSPQVSALSLDSGLWTRFGLMDPNHSNQARNFLMVPSSA